MECPGDLEVRHILPIDLRKPGIAHPAGIASVIGPSRVHHSLCEKRDTQEAAGKWRKETQDEADSFAHREKVSRWQANDGQPRNDPAAVPAGLPCKAAQLRTRMAEGIREGSASAQTSLWPSNAARCLT
jgi:hypothetical protein